MATPSRILAWRIPWTEEPGGLQPIESQRIRYNWSDLACTHIPSQDILILQCSLFQIKKMNKLWYDIFEALESGLGNYFKNEYLRSSKKYSKHPRYCSLI